MTDQPSATTSTRVRLLVVSLLAVFAVGATTAGVLRHIHMDRAEVMFLSAAHDTFPASDLTLDTLECRESLSAGLFKDETVRCKVEATHRGQPGRFLGFMSPDFDFVEVAFHADR